MFSSLSATPYCYNLTVKFFWDYVGNDIQNDLRPDLFNCCYACANLTTCLAFTYVLNQTRCYLKHSIGNGGNASSTCNGGAK